MVKGRENDLQETTVDARLAHALDDWYVRIGRQFGPLTRSQRRILRLIADASGLRVGDVAERHGLTTAGATRMVDKLEALGYARRYRAPREDQRHVRVALTPAGAEALRDADRVFVQAVGATLATLTAAERATLADLLHKIGDTAPPRPMPAPMAIAAEEGYRGE
jgi:DNA-binding MarR family transcriptional regulator